MLKHNKAVLAACLSIILALSGAAFAEGEMARLGDVNMDGTCNVLDIQATICQALQTQTRTREANLDEDDDVDVLDVQNCINTALGTGNTPLNEQNIVILTNLHHLKILNSYSGIPHSPRHLPILKDTSRRFTVTD